MNLLMYAMLEIKSNLVYVVLMIFRYSLNFKEFHWKTVKRIFKYIKNTLFLKITFKSFLKILNDHIDANWAKNRDIRKFISDYVFNLDSDVINWSFKRQSIVTLSFCEIEYMSQTQITKKTICLFILLNQINVSKIFEAYSMQNANDVIYVNVTFACFSISFVFDVVIKHCDNQNAVTLTKKFLTYARSKHINI